MSNSTMRTDAKAEWGEAVLQSLTAEMVADLTGKLASALEAIDDLLQPETLALLRQLTDASESLSRALAEVQRLEESGALKNLTEFSELSARMRSALTGPMVADMMEQGVKLIEWADILEQREAPERVKGMLDALESAQKERQEAEGPLSLFQMLRALSDPEVREGISLFLTLAKKLPKELYKS
jgi:uncharacterized protein YjgD (DUF1641 family)